MLEQGEECSLALNGWIKKEKRCTIILLLELGQPVACLPAV